ncbi:MAG: SDR family NAD(P)-dependent oxidoreductase [Alphaproteobacteria bacterium]|nr:SDR family NAD(P)-dependent oxidoreductase [Alphaproteobacteria bacterium]
MSISESDAALGLKPGDAVVVTGAARGIGRAIACLLAGRGARLAVVDIRDGAETVGLCEEAGAEARYFACDVSDEGQVTALANQVSDSLGIPFGLVNDAGVFPRFSVLETPLEEWNRALAVNLTGTFLCSRAFAPGMLEAGRGAIVNISSGAALRSNRNAAAYCASKAGILALTRSLALELGPAIRANTVLPGVTETDMPMEGAPVEEIRARGSQIPLGRIGQVEDIARAAGFLLSAEASYISGQGLSVNGGRTMVP